MANTPKTGGGTGTVPPPHSQRSAEYDAFGPWIDEVPVPGEIPRLYRDYPVDFAAAHVILKIPRDLVLATQATRDIEADPHARIPA